MDWLGQTMRTVYGDDFEKMPAEFRPDMEQKMDPMKEKEMKRKQAEAIGKLILEKYKDEPEAKTQMEDWERKALEAYVNSIKEKMFQGGKSLGPQGLEQNLYMKAE